MSKKITLGIQSPEGQKRVSILGSSKLEELYKEVQKAFGLPSTGFLLSQDQRKELKIENSKLRTVTQAKLKHGDRLFMHNSAELFQSTNSNSSSTTSPSVPSVIVVEDPLDVELGKQTGQIAKAMGQVKNCQCQGNSQCVHCIPYDPFDPEYLKDQGIKFMSFHSYLRMKSGGLSKVRNEVIFVQNLQYIYRANLLPYGTWCVGWCIVHGVSILHIPRCKHNLKISPDTNAI